MVEPIVSVNTQSVIFLVNYLLFSILLFGWCKSHVKVSQIKEPFGSAIICALIGKIGVPLYFFRAFGIEQGVIKTFWSLLFFIICIVIYIIPGSLMTCCL